MVVSLDHVCRYVRRRFPRQGKSPLFLMADFLLQLRADEDGDV